MEDQKIDTYYTRTGKSVFQQQTVEKKQLMVRKSSLITVGSANQVASLPLPQSFSTQTTDGSSNNLLQPTASIHKYSLQKTVKSCFIDIDTDSHTIHTQLRKGKENSQSKQQQTSQSFNKTLPFLSSHSQQQLEHQQHHHKKEPPYDRKKVQEYMKQQREERKSGTTQKSVTPPDNIHHNSNQPQSKRKYDSEELQKYIKDKSSHRSYVERSKTVTESERRESIKQKLKELDEFRRIQRLKVTPKSISDPEPHVAQMEYSGDDQFEIPQDYGVAVKPNLDDQLSGRVDTVLVAAEKLFSRISSLNDRVLKQKSAIVVDSPVHMEKVAVPSDFVEEEVFESTPDNQIADNKEIEQVDTQPAPAPPPEPVHVDPNETFDEEGYLFEESKLSISGDERNILATLEKLMKSRGLDLKLKQPTTRSFMDADSIEIENESFRVEEHSTILPQEEIHPDIINEQPPEAMTDDPQPEIVQEQSKNVAISEHEAEVEIPHNESNEAPVEREKESHEHEQKSEEQPQNDDTTYNDDFVSEIASNDSSRSQNSNVPEEIVLSESLEKLAKVNLSPESSAEPAPSPPKLHRVSTPLPKPQEEVLTNWPTMPVELIRDDPLPDFVAMSAKMIEDFISKEKSKRKEYELLLSLREQTVLAHVQAEIGWIRKQKSEKAGHDACADEMERVLMMRMATEKAEIQLLKKRLREDAMKRQKTAIRAKIEKIQHPILKPNKMEEALDVEIKILENGNDITDQIPSGRYSNEYSMDFEEASFSSKSSLRSKTTTSSDIPTEIASDSDRSYHRDSHGTPSADSSVDDSSLGALTQKLKQLKKRNDDSKLERKEKKIEMTRRIAKDLLDKRHKKLEWERKLKAEIDQINKVLDQALATDGSISSLHFDRSSSERDALSHSLPDIARQPSVPKKSENERDDATSIEGTIKSEIVTDEDSSIKEEIERESPQNSLLERLVPDDEEKSAVYSEDFSIESASSGFISAQKLIVDAANELIRRIRDLQKQVDDAKDRSFELRKQKELKSQTLYKTLKDKKETLVSRLQELSQEPAVSKRQAELANAIQSLTEKTISSNVQKAAVTPEFDRLDRDGLHHSNDSFEISVTIQSHVAKKAPPVPPSIQPVHKFNLSETEKNEYADKISELLLEDILRDVAQTTKGIELPRVASAIPVVQEIPAVQVPVEEVITTPKPTPAAELSPAVIIVEPHQEALNMAYVNNVVEELFKAMPKSNVHNEPFIISRNLAGSLDKQKCPNKNLNLILLDVFNEAVNSSFVDSLAEFSKLPKYLKQCVPTKDQRIPSLVLKQRVKSSIKAWMDSQMKQGDAVDILLSDEIRADEKTWVETAFYDSYVHNRVVGMIWDDLITELIAFLE